MSVKSEMIRLTKKLQQFYPEKHIDITASSLFYAHGIAFEWKYCLYVENAINHLVFESLRGMDAYIDAIQLDAKGE